MATQGNHRYQHDSAPEQASGAGKDPLAELARLIGQNDGYAKVRQAAQPNAAVPQAPQAAQAEPARTSYPQADLRGSYEPAHQPAAYAQHHTADRAPYAQPQAPATQQHYAADERYADEQYDPAYDTEYDQDYVEEEPKKRRGLKLVAAAVGLCVIGAAGALAYRSIGPSVSDPPPVIKASEQPNKIAGTPQTREPASRTTYDRANTNQPERVLTREEQPVEIKQAPRTVGSIPAPAVSSQATGMSPPPPTAEPKKVKTERILPNGAVATPSTGPRSDAAPRAPAAVRTASITPVVAATPSPAAAASSVPAGGHVVQVSSQKSENDAKASYRALQAKYPSVLAGKPPLIRKAELGDRGTVYRVQIGPFASAGSANDLCTNLKAAGGQCIVQRN